ncbi:diacylglycerol kinase (ATP) [Paenibacillus sp. UNCCL117]|uniref:diacylglycerol kinase family protein n=1 Tax=unclassified Paenibacillus TaxID=185978 RepID=UPI000888014D|nr:MULTISPECIES: diacylglycerol kinase family protein [unclassified Paenibacillus]SDC72502.1 diacylglycerol kinase (ATP) [Paenibacillus sp. cl123]SFW24785.1 diacylglycerol kinase (ATP) [Paenibacillus sp. UNCCL117]
MRQPAKWERSFRYAYEGVKYALATQRNMRFHFFAAFAALVAALLFGLPKTDVLFLLLAVTLVIVTELINTAIEKTVDLAMPDIHPLAKIAKDVAAAAVLVTAAFAVIAGMIVFYEPVDHLIRAGRVKEGHAFTAGAVWILLSLVILSVIVIQTRFTDKGNWVKPSLLSAVAFAVSTLIAYRTDDTLVSLLGFLLSGVLSLALHDKRRRPLSSLLLGALLGSLITVFSFYLYTL